MNTVLNKARHKAYPSVIGNFFTYLKSVELTDDAVIIHFKFNKSTKYVLDTFVGFPKIEYKYLHAIVTLGDINNTQIRLLNKKQTQSLIANLELKLQKILILKIKTVQQQLKIIAFDEYLRDSSTEKLAKDLLPMLKNYRDNHQIWHRYVDSDSLTAFKKLAKSADIDSLAHTLRTNYEQSTLKLRHKFYDSVESNPLTTEQRLAVVRDNDRNLILAAAGTGKTSVIIAKTLDIIDRDIALPENILILAYNKEAANELKYRFNRSVEKLKVTSLGKNNITKPPEIMTFHSLARLILRKSSLPTTVSPFAQQPKLQSAWLEDWLCKKIEDNTLFINKILSTIYLVERNPINNEMNISTSKSHPIFQTLPGYKVSNYPEYIIANYLYLNGIEHEFKQSSTYKSTANVPENISIFTLAADNICIEYCQKTTKNNTVLNKNRVYDSTNIRLTFADYNEGIIITKLCQFLNVAFSIKKISAQAIIAQLSRIGLLKKAVDSYLKALQTIKIENLSIEEIQNRIALINIENTEQFSEMLYQISDAYRTELLKDNSIDFDDMIINANDAVSKKIFVPKWEHILVDEFQDISSSRYKFLASLITFGNIEYERKNYPRIKKVKLTAVGDDWQSIYRFSGGNLELTTQFKKLVGTHTLSILQKTFRYNNSIADIAGKFIMENPEQYKKNVITNTQVDKPQVFLHDDVSRIEKSVKSIEQKIIKITQSIIKNNAKESIAIITRYRKQLNEIQSYFLYESKNPDSLITSHSKDIFSHEKISFWTYHGSKGLEADNTILVGFYNGFFGFPPTNQSKSLVDALLPKVDSYPHSEERRLMYVGLTRAKNKVHLIVDPNNCSVFIKELIKDKYDIKILMTNLKT